VANIVTLTVQDALAASDAPLKLIVPLPAVAAIVPLQVAFKPLGLATTNPAGSGSVKPIPVKVTKLFGFVIEKVSVVVLPGIIFVGVKPLVIEGGPTIVNALASELAK
jgi:hypothetical protein